MKALPGAEIGANVIKDTGGLLKHSVGIGIENVGSARDEPEQVSGTCIVCGARSQPGSGYHSGAVDSVWRGGVHHQLLFLALAHEVHRVFQRPPVSRARVLPRLFLGHDGTAPSLPSM